MIENFSDAIGFYTTVFFVLAGIYLLFVVSSRHHEQMLRKREEAYYNLLDEIREESDEKTYLLVAHNGIARVVHSYFYEMTNEEYAGFGIKNCEIRRYDF